MIGVTSPTAGCGKTVVSTNLALSIARHNRPVLLVDMDLQKPQVANYLGLNCKQGVLSVLEGKTDFASSIIEARIKNQTMSVLPCEASTLNSSEWMASRPMDAIMQQIRRDYKDCVVIFDLPPVLAGDDVITILPQLDCVLFVAAVGTTTVSDIKESNKHLEATSVVRFVLNKSAEMPATYYSRYAEALYREHKKRSVGPNKKAPDTDPGALTVRAMQRASAGRCRQICNSVSDAQPATCHGMRRSCSGRQLSPNKRPASGADQSVGSKVHIEIFGPNRPIPIEGHFDTATHRPARSGFRI